MTSRLVIKDYIRRWGNALQCPSCGYATPLGPHSKLQSCCGRPMTPVNTLTEEEAERLELQRRKDELAEMLNTKVFPKLSGDAGRKRLARLQAFISQLQDEIKKEEQA